jgi:alpha-L-rhamnosidase/Glycosyl hydrolases family 2, sugar binding domain
VTVATRSAGGLGGAGSTPMESLEVSGDGVNFPRAIDLPRTAIYQRTFAFAPVTGRYFRYRLPSLNSDSFKICRFQLHTATLVNRFEEKAGFATVPNYYEIATPEADGVGVVKKTEVIDLTGKMRPDGTLDWTAPAGDWMVIRMGYALTGQTNGPAPLEATGYEVDKLRKGATKTFMDEYLKLYEDASGGMMGEHGVNNVATDSWEAGLQNWTDGILADFKRLRGYDPTPWLPALTGRVVQSSDATDRFLWDFRRTIADLVITSNFDQVRDSLHERGLKYVTEAMAGRRAMLGDAMEMKARADFPMGEYWLPTPDRQSSNYLADLRDTAAVAHIYGKKVASAESITSTGIPYAYAPWDIKSVADEEFLSGINQFTLHVSVHQPNDNAPGLALAQYGMWFNRLETWAEQARAWTDYIARSSYMLQQGRAVIDVAYFYGEEGPSTTVNQAHAPEITDGYNYDFVNRESLLNEFSVESGKLLTKSGMKYQLLYLGGTSNRMTLAVLEKLRALVAAGAVVVGLPPVDSPSMSDDVTRWKAAARAIWPDKSLLRKVGLGKIYQTMNLGQVLGVETIQPDFAYGIPFADASVKFYHRVDGNADIYFVNNRIDKPMAINADFRVTGRAAEIWMADRGTVQPASYRIHDGVTTVPLTLEPRDAVFVVFRESAGAMSRTVVAPSRIKLADVKGPWEVEFQPGRGAPKSATFDDLSDWSNNANPGIKYFSGTATYTKTIEIPESALSQKSRIELDLGKVHEVAEVSVNGKTAGIAWKPPYRVDITGAVMAGANTLSIKVVNLWPNRLIGDQQPGSEKVTFAPNSTYKANSPLMPSGLIGPVGIDWLTEIK